MAGDSKKARLNRSNNDGSGSGGGEDNDLYNFIAQNNKQVYEVTRDSLLNRMESPHDRDGGEVISGHSPTVGLFDDPRAIAAALSEETAPAAIAPMQQQHRRSGEKIGRAHV